jgi:asparagine synthetase B (glutamine-hydrolysing)
LALQLPASVRYAFRKPKALLKAALAQRVTPEIAYRVKLGFGQPIFEWLRPGGATQWGSDPDESTRIFGSGHRQGADMVHLQCVVL